MLWWQQWKDYVKYVSSAEELHILKACGCLLDIILSQFNTVVAASALLHTFSSLFSDDKKKVIFPNAKTHDVMPEEGLLNKTLHHQ